MNFQSQHSYNEGSGHQHNRPPHHYDRNQHYHHKQYRQGQYNHIEGNMNGNGGYNAGGGNYYRQNSQNHNYPKENNYSHQNRTPQQRYNSNKQSTNSNGQYSEGSENSLPGNNKMGQNQRFNRQIPCSKHEGEALLYIKRQPQNVEPNMRNSKILLCNKCIAEQNLEEEEQQIQDENHLAFTDIHAFIEESSDIFMNHRAYIKDQVIIPSEIFDFIEQRELNINNFKDHNIEQKKQVDKFQTQLIKGFIDNVSAKMEDIKSTFDIQFEIYQNNYDLLTAKLCKLYDHMGIKTLLRKYHTQDQLKYQLRKIDFEEELSEYITEISCLRKIIQAVQNQNDIQAKNISKHQEQINKEMKKYIFKNVQQGAFPPRLDDIDTQILKKQDQSRLNFFKSYRELQKDLDESFQKFMRNLNPIQINFDFSTIPFFQSTEENILGNKDRSQSENNKQSNSSLKNKSHRANSSLSKRGIATSNSLTNNSITSESINENPSSQKNEIIVQTSNYFNMDTRYKVLHFFESGSTILNLLNLSQLSQNHQRDIPNFHTVNLSQNNQIPFHHCSIITPCGKLFLSGGLEDKDIYKSFYEYSFELKTLIPKSSMFESRCFHGICMLDHRRIMVAGGLSNESGILKSCEVYDFKSNEWEVVAPLNKPSENHSLCLFNGKFIFKVGGRNGNPIEKYIINENKWVVVNIGDNIKIGQSCESIQINKNQILIYGGICQGVKSAANCFILTVDEEGQCSLKSQNDASMSTKYYFSPKSAIVHDDIIYSVSNGSQKILAFEEKRWVEY